MAGRIYVGTSGWVYKSWARDFYPPGVTSSRLLSFYASRFPTVEINASFYRLPSLAAFDEWRAGARQLRAAAARGIDAFVYFKHEGEGKGPELAIRIRICGNPSKVQYHPPSGVIAPPGTVNHRRPSSNQATEYFVGHSQDTAPRCIRPCLLNVLMKGACHTHQAGFVERVLIPSIFGRTIPVMGE